MLSVSADITHAARGLRKSPAFTAIAVASLALGIGANVTIYSVVREMIFDDLSARQPDRLARVIADVSYAQYRDLQRAAAFQDLAFEAGFFDMNWNIGTRSEVAWELSTSANFFDVLGVGAARGRSFTRKATMAGCIRFWVCCRATIAASGVTAFRPKSTG
jgi:hypothetical protein